MKILFMPYFLVWIVGEILSFIASLQINEQLSSILSFVAVILSIPSNIIELIIAGTAIDIIAKIIGFICTIDEMENILW